MVQTGTRLGPYEVVGPLGAGGMGEVYRARDPRLGRDVAIKVLPSDLTGDEELRRRFEREARAIAALNHPHICTLYDVGRERGIDYLVMELIEGGTLADRLRNGPLAIHEALSYAAQIADALATAHRHGIVHRDLKPGNVMLARGGSGSGAAPRAKLLDFGVARLRTEAAVAMAEAATATAALTGAGKILGTLNYMAPEQLEGKPHDARVDVFAFGAIVFEMMTGRRAFDGSNPASVAGAVLHTSPPPISAVVPGAPPALEHLVAVCLARNPDDRWSTANDVLLQLRSSAIVDPASAAAPARRPRREWVGWGVAAGLAAVLVAAMTLPRGTPDAAPAAGPELLSILPPPGAATSHSWEAPQISPDGRQIAFAASDESGTVRLYVRSRSALEARALPGTEDATLPFWSPDSTMLGFFAAAQLKAVAIAGGTPRTLAPAPVARGGTWGADGRILFSAIPNAPPQLVPATGGEITPAPVASQERGFRSFPWLLPDGRHYLYLSIEPATGQPRAIRIASLDSAEVKDVAAAKGNGMFVNGWLLYLREATLVGQRFSITTLQVEGPVVAFADDVGFNGITYQALFSVSGDAIAYLGTPRGAQLRWFDRQGRALDAVTPPGDFNTICLSADQRQAIYEQTDPLTGSVDLWRIDLATHQPTRLTFDPAVDFYPICGPPGATAGEVFFSSLRSGPPSLFRLPVSVPGSEKPALVSYIAKIPSHWTHDGRHVVYSVLNPKTGWDVAVWPAAGGESRMIAATDADERAGRVSPDGRWLAYSAKDRLGRFEIYVQPFPGGGSKWQVSRAGGSQPLWSGDGGELYFVSQDRRLMAAQVRTGGADFDPGEPRTLVEAPVVGRDGPNVIGAQYAATADAQRFLISVASADAAPITLLRNWRALGSTAGPR